MTRHPGKRSAASGDHRSGKPHGKRGQRDHKPHRRASDDFSGRPNFYKDHWDNAHVRTGLSEGSLLAGRLRVSGHHPMSAFVKCFGLDRDVMIRGLENRNRGLHGDLVAVRLLPESEWEKRPIRDTGADAAEAPPSTPPVSSAPELYEGYKVLPFRPTPESGNPHTARGQLITGEVVAVLERRYPLTTTVHSGYLSTGRAGNAVLPSDTYVLFIPLDPSMVHCFIPLSQAPAEFLADPARHNKIYTATLTDWKPKFRMPNAKLGDALGAAGDIEVESQALLISYNVHHTEQFAADVVEQLAPFPPEWTIPADEIARRRDLRETRIFSIDPPTARDLDDALSVRDLGGGVVEVGVHIADPTFFFAQESPLDLETARRATSVYLVQRAIPMMPRVLSEHLCSLRPTGDRLGYSCVFHMDAATGALLGDSDSVQEHGAHAVWFGRTVIRSCSQLDYPTAQGMIDGTVATLDDMPEFTRPPASSPFAVAEIAADVQLLDRVAKARRAARFATGGSLSINKVKLSYVVDEDDKPVEVGMYVHKDANKLVEEFMLLANKLVARKILDAAQGSALLRRHPPLIPQRAEELAAYATRCGFPVDEDSAGKLHQSLQALKGKKTASGLDAQYVVEELMMKSMRPAEYFAAGTLSSRDEYRHYALNFDLYTHFTSPIRRYADCTVHRLLTWALAKDAKAGGAGASAASAEPAEAAAAAVPYSADQVKQISANCNVKKEEAKKCSDQSALVYLCVFLAGQARVERAVVVDIRKHSFKVLVPKYGIEREIEIESAPSTKASKHTKHHKGGKDGQTKKEKDAAEPDDSGAAAAAAAAPEAAASQPAPRLQTFTSARIEGAEPDKTVVVSWPGVEHAQQLSLLDGVLVRMAGSTQTPIDVTFELLPPGWTPTTPEETTESASMNDGDWLPDVTGAKRLRLHPATLDVD